MLSGMDSFLSRPVELVQLVEVVESLGRALLMPPPSLNSTVGDDHRVWQSDETSLAGFDGPLALRLCGGDAELFRQLAAAFEQRAMSLLAEVRDAITAQERLKIRSSIHTLARLAATSAMPPLLEKCLTLAAATASPNTRGLAKLSSGLSQEIENTARELGQFSSTLSSDSVPIK
jgi:HPt (histidine-containing phosphotransfer) domain-containing protein